MNNVPINGPLLKEKANEIANKMQLGNFNCSNGFIDRFKIRHGLNFKNVCGESATVSREIVDDFNTRLPMLLEWYDSECIYYMEKTGIFSRPPRLLTFTITPRAALSCGKSVCVTARCAMVLISS